MVGRPPDRRTAAHPKEELRTSLGAFVAIRAFIASRWET